ncbi:MAG: hypothetical protein ABF630_11605 [Liquorilactobacillus sp.]
MGYMRSFYKANASGFHGRYRTGDGGFCRGVKRGAQRPSYKPFARQLGSVAIPNCLANELLALKPKRA